MFNITKLQFEVEILNNNPPYGYLGARLRGGLGHALKETICTEPEIKKCEKCEKFTERNCDFPFLFKPKRVLFDSIPKGRPLDNNKNLPMPFVISAPHKIDLPLYKGSRLIFEFTGLSEMTHKRTLRIIEAFGKMGETGLDARKFNPRTKRFELVKLYYQLLDVRDLLNAGRSLFAQGQFKDGPLTEFNEALVIDVRQITRLSLPIFSPKEIVIEFLTPTTIYHGGSPKLKGAVQKKGKTPREIRDFFVLVESICERLGLIWQAYGHDWIGRSKFYSWQNALIAEAKKIRIVHSNLEPENQTRFNKNGGKNIRMDGFTKTIVARGDFSKILEIILLGEILHIGKNITYGFGHYKTAFRG